MRDSKPNNQEPDCKIDELEKRVSELEKRLEGFEEPMQDLKEIKERRFRKAKAKF